MARIKRVAGALGIIVSFASFLNPIAFSADVVPGPGTPQTMDHAGFLKQVQPFFNKYCIECHSPSGSESGVTFDSFKDQESLLKAMSDLEKAAQMLHQLKMPPKRKPQPTEAERKAVAEWLESFTSGVDCSKPETLNPGRVTLRRLNRAEYNNTIRDLLAIDYHPADTFPVDDSGYGFDNIGDVLSVAPMLMEKYMTAAEVVMNQAIMVDPILPAPIRLFDANISDGTVPKTPGGSGTRSTRGNGNAEAGNGRIFYYNGEIHEEYDFPKDGTYYFRLRGYSNAGTNSRIRPQVQFYVDGQPAGKPVTVSNEQRLIGIHSSGAVNVTAGKHRIALAVLNSGTREEYDAAVEAARIAALSPATQPLNASGSEGAVNVALQPADDNPAAAQPLQRGAREGRRGRGPAAPPAAVAAPAEENPVAPAAAQQPQPVAAAPRAGGRGRGPAVPPAPPAPTGHATFGIHSFEIEGPMEPTLDRMPESYRRVMVAAPSSTLTKSQAAEQIIRNFAAKAYRRPTKDDEVQRLLSIWTKFDENGEKFEESISNTLAIVLASPHFLYRLERDPTPDEGAVRTLGEYELASRLSYFLWSSMPDAELSSLAAQGKLRTNLDAQLVRMLQDPKSRALVDNFGGQWLQLRMMDVVIPDPKLFPDFDPALRAAMTTETQMLFDTIIKEDRSVLDFIDADFTFLNERLAKHYGIEGITGEKFQRVKLASPDRGGLLTQGSILTITSYANRTSPVLRGKWVLENLFDTAPPPPPPNVPQLADEKQLKGTLRQRMEQHRENPACAGCHEQMDAIGFGLENFDGIGAWRAGDGDAPIDPSGTLPGGKSFSGPAQLKQIIKSQDEVFARALTVKLMTYATGRGMEKFDRCTIDTIVNNVKQSGYKFSVLVHEIVYSDPFQKRSAK
jgi:hypothetical protein